MAAANECIPFYEDDNRVTGSAEAAVTGKRFVDISDPIQSGPLLNTGVAGGNLVVSHATAAGKVFGVASHDAGIGKKVTILRKMIVPVTASADIATGAEVEVATGGKAVTLSAGRAVGRCLTACLADADAMIELY
jgi:predicted RecA/RadA family phage recombinase